MDEKTNVAAGGAEAKEVGARAERLWEVVGVFLRLGFTAFGGPAAHIAMMRQEIAQRRRWVSAERFVDLIGLVNLIPGPSSTQLAIYLGYLRAGWPGLIVAGVCFIGPAMLIVLAFAWAYVTFGSLPQTGWLLYGIKPVVIAIIAVALWGLFRIILKGALPVIFLVLILVAYLAGLNTLLALFGGGIVYGLVRMLTRRSTGKPEAAALPMTAGSARSAGKALATTSAATAAATAAVPFSQWTLFFTFLKIGVVLYGSGYVLLAFLRADFVHGLGWLSDKQLLDAVSVGQFTPGPVFTTATFVGYLVGGWQGALVATLGIFLPSFAFIPIIHPIAARLRRSPWTAALLDGINVAALALMAGVLLQLGQNALSDVLTWAVALIAFVILLRFKLNSALLILVGAAIGVVRFWLF